MVTENADWGAPRIHGELLKLGIDVGERTVSRYVVRARPGPRRRQDWKTFLHNHRDVLTAMDFLTVPTATFRVLYVWFVLHHDRRRILHVNVAIRAPHGSASSCVRGFPMTRPRGTWGSTAMRSSRRRCAGR